MFEAVAAPVLNRLLGANSWAREKLAQHAGKTVLLESPPFSLRLTLRADGSVAAAAADATADARIQASPALLVRLLARDESAWGEAAVTGDVELAAAIDSVRRHLRWDYEEDLSRFVGDIAAHRIAGGVRALESWVRDGALNLGRAVAEYAVHESPLIAGPEAVEEWVREVDEVRDTVERLEKRIESLQRAHAVS